MQLKAGAAELSVGSQGPGAVALLLRSVKAAHSPVHRKHYLSLLVSALTLLGRPQRTHIHKLPEVLLALGLCVRGDCTAHEPLLITCSSPSFLLQAPIPLGYCSHVIASRHFPSGLCQWKLSLDRWHCVPLTGLPS